jgi:hypothetical protein
MGSRWITGQIGRLSGELGSARLVNGYGVCTGEDRQAVADAGCQPEVRLDVDAAVGHGIIIDAL